MNPVTLILVQQTARRAMLGARAHDPVVRGARRLRRRRTS